MSKDFEKSYKELAENEAPDLWDRIEAGLLPGSSTQTKTAAETHGAPVEETEAETAAESAVFPAAGKKKEKKKEFLFRLRKYSAMAAAVICVIMILPIFFRMNRASGYYESDSSAEADITAAQEADEAALEGIEAAGGAEDTAMLESTAVTEDMEAEDTAMEESATVTEGADTGGVSVESAQADQMEDTESRTMVDELKKESMQSQSPKREEEILSHVIVEVAGSESVSAKENFEEGGTVYTAVVREDPEGILAEGEEITVFIPVYSSIALAQGGIFELDLGRQEDESDSFIVCGYYGWWIE